MADDPNTPEPEENTDDEIRRVSVQDELRESYMQYAMSVITSRALPDVRDGFKPSQRRVIYAMSQLNVGPRSRRVKSARVVGETMGRFHPHGDSAIYATLVRMAQDFRSRYVLVDKKGNFGTLSEPSAAAMRYTECRMADAAADMVADLQYQTVDMRDNYDNSTVEPVVLPSKFPNLLCNGSQGIAVGMATSIPPHNLNEIADGLIALINNPEISDSELFALIPGPDFPTGGVICGTSGIRQAYKTGRGSITLRGGVEITEKKGRTTITINQLPYNVTIETLKEKIQNAYKDKRLEGVAALKDRSKGDVNILIECKRGEDPHVVLNNLYKFTPLQTTFSIIMIALEEHEGRFKPRTFSLREILKAFIDHRLVVIRRRSEFLLDRTLARIHVLEGLQKALDAIDDVIAIIRGAESADAARVELMARLEVSTRQAKEILNMRLQTLAGLERQKITDELEEREREATDLREILKVRARQVAIFTEDMAGLRKKYGDKRRTLIDQTEIGGFEDEDLIAVEDAVITVTHQGYIKRTALDEYRVQNRAGKGLYGANTRDDDFVEEIFQASTKDYVLCFTSKGRVHWIKVHRIPEGSRTARGRGIRNLIALLPEEKVTSLIPIKGDFTNDRFVVMASEMGVIKKTVLSAFKNPRKAGVIAVNLDDGDELVGVRITSGDAQLVLATRCGKAIRFPGETVRPMGRSARGVKGLTLGKDDRVVSLVVVGEDGPYLLTACEQGYGKRTAIEEYRETNRGGKGIINIKITPKNGYVVGVSAVKPGDQAMLITTSGKLIRVPVDDVSAIGRSTQGVRIIRVEDGEQVAAVAKVVLDSDDGSETSSEGEALKPKAEPEADADDEAL